MGAVIAGARMTQTLESETDIKNGYVFVEIRRCRKVGKMPKLALMVCDAFTTPKLPHNIDKLFFPSIGRVIQAHRLPS